MLKMISVQDTKAKAFLNPIVVPTSAVGLRQFEAQCKNKESLFNQHPSDFILFELGEFNETAGTLHPYDAPLALATASEFIQ